MITVTPVILVGGLGMRLWPLSRRDRPKQFHALTGSASMLQETAQRVRVGVEGGLAFAPPVVISGEAHAALVREEIAVASGSGARLVLEPVGRSTAACAVVSAALVGAADPGALVLLLPSDHHIADAQGFREAVARAAPAAQEGRLVTFGVPAVRPETGYGYILAEGDGAVRPVRSFVEKPDAVTAAAYVADGRYFWNAGVFLMRADLLLEEMARFEPEILDQAREALGKATQVDGALRLDAAALQACPSESLDRAVMERTTRAAVAPMNVGWSDVGAFDALWEAGEKDPDGNVVAGDVKSGDVALVSASGCYVRSDGPVVAVMGVEDLVVVVDRGVVLVVPRHKAQGVKEVVEWLRAQGRDDVL